MCGPRRRRGPGLSHAALEDEVKDANAVLDLVGGETQMRSFQVLRRGGKLISAVSQPDHRPCQEHGITAAFFLVEVTPNGCAASPNLLIAAN